MLTGCERLWMVVASMLLQKHLGKYTSAGSFPTRGLYSRPLSMHHLRKGPGTGPQNRFVLYVTQASGSHWLAVGRFHSVAKPPSQVG